jgi:hypothetical protein
VPGADPETGGWLSKTGDPPPPALQLHLDCPQSFGVLITQDLSRRSVLRVAASRPSCARPRPRLGHRPVPFGSAEFTTGDWPQAVATNMPTIIDESPPRAAAQQGAVGRRLPRLPGRRHPVRALPSWPLWPLPSET